MYSKKTERFKINFSFTLNRKRMNDNSSNRGESKESSNYKTLWVILITFALVLLIVLIIYLIAFFLIRQWNSFQVKQSTGYRVQPGDIILRRILGFGTLANVYHMGIISADMRFVYHRTLTHFDKTPIKSFMHNEKIFYIVHFPDCYYRPLDVSFELLEEQVNREKKRKIIRGFFTDFNLITKNCEAKVLPLRLHEQYADRYLHRSIQIHQMLCKHTRLSRRCETLDTETLYFLTRHDIHECC